MKPTDRAAIEAFIAQRGVTKCPTAYLQPVAVAGAEPLGPVPHDADEQIHARHGTARANQRAQAVMAAAKRRRKL